MSRLSEQKVARDMAHAAFDELWLSGVLTRTRAYAWLAEALGVPQHKAHMAHMSIAQCRQVVQLCMRRRWSLDLT